MKSRAANERSFLSRRSVSLSLLDPAPSPLAWPACGAVCAVLVRVHCEKKALTVTSYHILSNVTLPYIAAGYLER